MDRLAATMMKKMLSTFGFCAGVALLTLMVLNIPTVAPSNASETAGSACRMVEMPIDEGYGVSPVELRQVCDQAR